MALLSLGNIIGWGIAAVICAFVANKKSKNIKLALLMGILFRFFSMIYYLFSKSNNKKWNNKYSWYILIGYILFIILESFIEVLMGL